MILAENIEPGKIYYDNIKEEFFLVLEKKELKDISGLYYFRFRILWLTGKHKNTALAWHLFEKERCDVTKLEKGVFV